MKPATATAKSARLTVATIVRNCASAASETLACAGSIADEIVVLDTGSTDDTLAVAAKAGAVVHRRAWDDDFAAARNACLDKATGDWVLWLDAGETLAPEEARLLREFIDVQASEKHAYLLGVVLAAAPGQLGCEQVARLRLHPRLAGLRFAGRIRESLGAALQAQEIQVDSLPFVIERGRLHHEAEVKAARAQRNIRLADLQLTEEGPKAELHNVLGEAFQSLDDSARAAQHYRRALDLSTAGTRDQLEAYYGLLTCLDGVSADRADQLALCMLALERFPLDAQLLVALGGYLQALGHPELAIRSFDVGFRHGQIEPQIWHLPEIREIAASCAAAVLIETHQDESARTLLEAAVRTLPHSQRLAGQLIELYVNGGQREQALAAIRLVSSAAIRERLTAAVRGVFIARQGDCNAAADLLQAAMLDGCRERFCLRGLVQCWLKLDRPLDAQAVLQAWQAFDPQFAEIGEVGG
ncbi:MAG: glycosyltransferase, partial [Pirellulaceae bacterium]